MTSHNHSATAKVTTWHRQTAEAVLEAFSCDPELGLTDEQIRCRQASFGPNALPPPRPPSRWRRFLSQCQNVLIYVLLAAALVTALLGHGLDCAVILGVVLINALIGYLQEGKAEQALTAIRALLSPWPRCAGAVSTASCPVSSWYPVIWCSSTPGIGYRRICACCACGA